MDSKEIESKVKEIGKKVAEVSKSAFDKASVKVQDFTDKSILKIDIKKLQVKQNELYKNLGEIVSKFLSEEIINQLGIDNPAEKENILSIQNEIIELEKQIQQKQSELYFSFSISKTNFYGFCDSYNNR